MIISLAEGERLVLERIKRSRRVPVRLIELATIVLHAADGHENRQSAVLGLSQQYRSAPPITRLQPVARTW